MDDDLHISGVHRVGADQGHWVERDFRWLPAWIWDGVEQQFGLSSPAFHALTLGTHLLIACLLYPLGSSLLRASRFLEENPYRGKLAAWIAALVFVSHPLTTEPVHYARCFMIDLVTLFTLLTAWCSFRFARRPTFPWAGALLAAIGFATISKQTGLFHAGAVAGVALLAFADWESIRHRAKPVTSYLRTHRLSLSLMGSGLLILCSPFLRLPGRIAGQPYFLEHIATQCRVFWGYVQRILVPTNLSVDHYIPWTMNWRDPAWIAGALGMICLLLLMGWMLTRRRWRFAAVLATLALVHLLLRFINVGPEAMVEYRLYPAMPWLALLMGCGLAALIHQRRRAGIALCAMLLVTYTGLSMNRSALWTDPAKLAQNAVSQYPLNLRAIGSIQYDAALNNDPETVLALSGQGEAAFWGSQEFNRNHRFQQYEISRLHLWHATFLQHQVAATAKLKGAPAGLAEADRLIAEMSAQYPRWYDSAPIGSTNPLLEIRDYLANWIEEMEAARIASER